MSNKNYIVSSKFSELEFKLHSVTNSNFGRDWHSSMHFHYYAELFYITSGSGSFRISEEIINVKENDLIIINPNNLHTEYSFDKDPMKYICLGIEDLYFENVAGEDNKKHKYLLINLAEHRETILDYLTNLLYEVDNKPKYYEISCHSIFSSFLIYLIRNINSDFKVRENTQEASIECVNVKEYIDYHYNEDITLDTLASLTYINKYHLAHSFKKYVGISPINYLIKQRIEKSKFLLNNTNYTVDKIAEIIGFNSSSYFSQAFKKQVGASPKEYKITNKKNNKSLNEAIN